MATTTLTLIAKQTVGSGGASSVSFTNIPQTFTDLMLVTSLRNSGGNTWAGMVFNGSSTNFTSKNINGNGTTAASQSVTNYVYVAMENGSTDTANTFASSQIYIPNYTSSNYKSFSVETVRENNSTSAEQFMWAFLYSNTNAITSITFNNDNGAGTNFAEFSTFYLYGISNSSTQNTRTPYALGGDVIVSDGTYWYHTFLYSGTFTPLKGLTCDYLVVAGGGGASRLSGGGAGGLRSTVTATGGGGSLESALSLTASTAYTVTVGAGGTYGTNIGGTAGTSGSNSVFSTITSTGGGYGAAANGAGGNGGSGGGGWNPGAGGSGTTNQGYAGAGGTQTPYGMAGGGAGAVGSGYVGGNGVATSISGSSVTYAGGGAGSANNNTVYSGGSGGGGSSNSGTGSNGTANTGGGGAGINVAGGGTGGSGIVIVRYAV